jgi:hypothetical protein
MRFLAFIAFLIGSILGNTSDSYGYYCSEPSAPSCIAMLGISRDEFTFDMCRNQVRNYLSEVEDYKQCLIRTMDQVNEEADDAIRKFNCYAEGNEICF